MAVSPQDFKVFAEGLDRSSEIGLRNAISRLYYGIFLEVNDIFPSNERYESTGTHESFIHTLRNPKLDDPNQILKRRLAAVLDQAKTWRVVADYKIDQQIESKQFDIIQRSIDKILPEVRAIKK